MVSAVEDELDPRLTPLRRIAILGVIILATTLYGTTILVVSTILPQMRGVPVVTLSAQCITPATSPSVISRIAAHEGEPFHACSNLWHACRWCAPLHLRLLAQFLHDASKPTAILAINSSDSSIHTSIWAPAI